MSLDIITSRTSFNTTHNHAPIARALGIHDLLWNGMDANGKRVRTIGELRKPIAEALERIEGDWNRLQALNPTNGWGSVEAFQSFLVLVLAHATIHPRLRVTFSA